MNVSSQLWQRLISLVRGATPDNARPTLNVNGDVRPVPAAKWLPKVEAVRPEFNRLILEANRHSEVAPSHEAVEFCREAWAAAIAELTGDNEPEYKRFRRPGAAEREARFQLQDDLEGAKIAALQLAADLEAAQIELSTLKQRGWLARLFNR